MTSFPLRHQYLQLHLPVKYTEQMFTWEVSNSYDSMPRLSGLTTKRWLDSYSNRLLTCWVVPPVIMSSYMALNKSTRTIALIILTVSRKKTWYWDDSKFKFHVPNSNSAKQDVIHLCRLTMENYLWELTSSKKILMKQWFLKI